MDSPVAQDYNPYEHIKGQLEELTNIVENIMSKTASRANLLVGEEPPKLMQSEAKNPSPPVGGFLGDVVNQQRQLLCRLRDISAELNRF